MKVLHNGQAVIVGLDGVDLDDFPNLKVVGCNMTGTEHLPLEECEKRGIKVISLKGETEFLKDITSTAEHTIGLMIALMRNYKNALNGPYQEREVYKGHVLAGKTLGVIGGLGRIGSQIASIASGLEMQGLLWDFNGEGLFTNADSFEDFVSRSDIVSIHIPLSGNKDFFTKKMFRQMKATAYLINTSRDGVIEKGALKWALENKIIAGAGVDFIDDPELVEYAKIHDNLILTNHIGGCTYEDMEKTEAFIVDKIDSFFKEKML